MIKLDISLEKQALIEQASKKAGMTVEAYILSKVFTESTPSDSFNNNIHQLKGRIKTNKKLSVEEMNQVIAEAGCGE